MFKIGVVSDTHARTMDELSPQLLKAFTGVDLIVHAGDFTRRAILDGLRTITEVKAVCGNMDSEELRKILPIKDGFTVAGKRVGLVHGSGPPWGIAGRVREMFGEEDIIIFGHSHLPCNQCVKGSLLFNPGSGRESYGILTIDSEVGAEVIQI